MTRLPRIVTLFGSGLLLAACGQLIGLSDFESVDEGDAGEAGASSGGKAGRGGSAGGGTGGNAGEATGGTGDRGGAGGTAGGSSGSGGTAGEVGVGGTGGTGGSEGGAGGDAPGGGGQGGEPDVPRCRELSTIEFVSSKVNEDEGPEFISSQYEFAFLPNLGSSLGDAILMEFYESADQGLNGSATGTFEFGTDIDVNFETCARCLRVFQDVGSTALEKTFFATSGTLTIADDSLQVQGFASMTLRDVTLVEVTIDDDAVSTPVDDGECLHFTSIEYSQPPPPPEWTCVGAYYTDSDCDCGCGAPDPACATPYASSCEFCGLEGACSTSECEEVQVDNNAVCVSPQPWLCGPTTYADGVCDCGCGIADIDCADGSFEVCEACHCTTEGTSCEGAAIDPADNALCAPQ